MIFHALFYNFLIIKLCKNIVREYCTHSAYRQFCDESRNAKKCARKGWHE